MGNEKQVKTINGKNFSFTQRERDILIKLGEGKSNKEIAEELYISLNTVKTHLKSIFVKLNVSSRLQAAAMLKR